MGTLIVSTLIFIDETWAGLAMTRRYGYSPAGEPAVIHAPIRGPKVSVIGAMSADGPEALAFVKGGVNGAAFVAWIRDKLARRLKPGSLVVMDQLSVHRMASVREELAKHGAKPLFLPPYSPELNPIEHLWAIVKDAVKKTRPSSMTELIRLFGQAWGSVPKTVFSRTVAHCGYASSI